jgi:hypothetical protein
MKALFFLGALFVPALARHSLDDAADIQARRLADLERMLKGSQELPASFAHHGMPDLSVRCFFFLVSLFLFIITQNDGFLYPHKDTDEYWFRF